MSDFKFKKFAWAALAIGALFLSSCEWLSNPDKDGDFDISEDELNGLIDTLVLKGLEELGLGELGGILLDSTEYENIPDTVIVVDTVEVDTVEVDPIDPDPVDPKDPVEPESQFRSADLSNYFPTILSQGIQGSCTGWASSAIRSYYINKEEDNTSTLNQKRFSPAYIYNNIKVDGCDGGSYTAWAAEFLVTNGDVLEEDSPYDEDKCSELNESLKTEAAKYKLSKFKRITHDIEQFKSWLDKDVPLLVSMIVDDNFMDLSAEDDLYEESDVIGYGGGHAIVINGYSDSLNAFQFHNSWGTYWANEGKAWVDYQATMDILKEAFVVLE